MPTSETAAFTRYDATSSKRRPFDIWYYTGILTREDLEAAGCDCEGMEQEQIPAVVTMVNNRVIKAALNPLDSGEFPYDVICWQMREGFWAGIGVGQHISVAQEGVNAATRNMMDNAGISSGVQIVALRGVIEPADGKWEITNNKIWYAKADADIVDVEKAFISIEIPSLQVELMNIIQFYLKMAEDITGMPAMLQGQLGKAPDTVGGMTMLQNNASAVLRRLARLFDDNIIEPHIGRYYDWLMQHGDDPEEKGDFTIDARASTVLVERDIQNQFVLQFYPIAKDPGARIDMNKYTQEILKSQKLDPKRFQYDDEEWKRVQEAMQKQPQDPRIAVAQIKTEFDAQENAKDRKHEAAIKLLEAELNMAEQEGRKQIDTSKIRAALADTMIKVKAQERISDKTNVVKQLSKPPTEPRGKAPRGQAYQR
jgi:hypothetical protein